MKNSITLQVMIMKSNIRQELLSRQTILIHSSHLYHQHRKKRTTNIKNRTPGKFIAAQKNY